MNKKITKNNIMSNFTDNKIIVSDSECDSDNDSNEYDFDNNEENSNDDDNNNKENSDNGYDTDKEKENFHSMVNNKKINKINKKNKINITREYLNYHNEYSKKYEKSLVLIQVGSFYELYSIVVEGPDIYELCQLLNITATKKDKSKKQINESNPLMIGFPIHAVTKFVNILLNESYTIIIINQKKKDITIKNKKGQDVIKTEVTRFVDGIYSPSTYVETIEAKNKYLVTFYIEVNSSLQDIKNNYSIGMCSVDLTINDLFYHESHDNSITNDNSAIKEASRFYHYYRPVEMIFYFINNTKSKIDLNKILDEIDIIPDQCIYKYNTISQSFSSLNYQNKLFSKIYKTGIIDPITHFDLEKFCYSVISMVATFDFIHSHNNKLLNDIKSPVPYDKGKYLILGNAAQYQLGIIDYYNVSRKNFSLYSIINNCKTSMGKRFLKNRLCTPLTNIDEINNYYEYTDSLINNDLYNDCRNYLMGILDVKKLFRKININGIQPYELYNLYESCNLGRDLFEFLSNSKFKKHLKNFFTNDDLLLLKKSIKFIEKNFNLSVIKNINLKEIKESFYNNGIHPEIDNLMTKINGGYNYFEELSSQLAKITGCNKFNIKHNDRDGYYLATTKIRGDVLLKLLEKKKDIKINEQMTIKSHELKLTFNVSSCKVTCPSIGAKTKEIHELYFDLHKLATKTYSSDVDKWYVKYTSLFDKMIDFITEIDYISNNAFNANKYHYCRPVIDVPEQNKDVESFVLATQMRHPIIERNINHEYVPHDACLDKNTRGNLIYGVNSCGKSSLMKSIGVNIIMAQCGLYVPAVDFTYYPFNSLYTRITGSDDASKGLSSFVLELHELGNILKKSNKNTLIIGDEICRGTEYLSANSLVASSIMKINKSKAKYIFATHLHELSRLERIKNLKKMKMFHLSVEYKDDELFFNRKLVEGNGEEVYGITVAKYILNDPEFIDTAIEFKNELLTQKNINSTLLSDKKSTFNKKIIVDSCHFCGSSKKLESHHINFQKFFSTKSGEHKDINKKHIIKNSESNVVVMCSNCHDDLHGGKFSINTIIQTSSGPKPI